LIVLVRTRPNLVPDYRFVALPDRQSAFTLRPATSRAAFRLSPWIFLLCTVRFPFVRRHVGRL